MSTDNKADLLIIGAGPGGYAAAFHAADAGMQVTLVDPEINPGGVCLYRGCIPSKALLHVASFLHEVEQASEWGISLNEPEIDRGKLVDWKESVVKKLTEGLGQLIKQRKIRYVQGTAKLNGPNRAEISPAEDEAFELEFEHAVLATGSIPATLSDMPDSNRIMTSREALDVEEIPNRLLVIGGGYIGLELGQVYAALGSKVTVVEMLPDLLAGADRDLVKFLARRLDQQFERVMTDTKVKEIKETDDGIHVVFEDGTINEGTFDKVMMSVGRKPHTEKLGLDQTGVNVTEKGFIEIDDQQHTADPSIYAIGDVAGQPMLAHKAAHEARVAIEAIAGKNTVFDPRAIPFVVFTDPEIAWCGLSQMEAEKTGTEVKITTFPWAASGRATTISRNDGITKLLLDPESGRVLGVGMAGHGAGELLSEAVLAMEMGAVAEDLALTIHTHPTLSETLMEAAQAFSGHSTHFKKRNNPKPAEP